MKKKLTEAIENAARELARTGKIPGIALHEAQVSIPKDPKFGDYATNYAMALAKEAGKSPRDLAAMLIGSIGDGGGIVRRAEVAGPGFINFFVNAENLFGVLKRIEEQGERFGRTDLGARRKVQVEFVSANPTGPLHVGHGRNAVFGDTLARIMQAAGLVVLRYYYVNDSGFQIQTLGKSTYLRYREQLGEKVEIPQGYYVGDYLVPIAEDLRAQRGDGLTESDIPEISQFAAKKILDSIKSDTAGIGIKYDNWFFESSLHESGRTARTLQWMRDKGLGFDKDGALWFDTTRFGDDKDRVLVKSDGEKTYFAADVAYHADKYERGFDLVINVWGADHHGYIPRMKAAVQALGRSPDDLEVMLIQLVTLMRGGQVQQMSTRAGAVVTLAELASEVGSDALRYFYLMRRHDAQLEFDIDLAKERSNANPVFYVQYMHARICSIFEKARKEGVSVPSFDGADISLLSVAEEKDLVRHLAEFPELVALAAKNREPHRLIGYLYELANRFHYYYHHNRVMSEDPALTASRLLLCKAARQVLRNALGLCGISAPESM